MAPFDNIRVAIVHDYLNQWGGAERVLLELHHLFPKAPIYTSLWDRCKLKVFSGAEIRTTFIDRLPMSKKNHQLFLLLYPIAFKRLRIHADLIISSSSAFAKGVTKRSGSVHVCYCHSPMRFAWNFDQYVAREALPGPAVAALPPFMGLLRAWDRWTSRAVDRFVANSATVAERILRFYGRKSSVVHPPVDVEAYPLATRRGQFFLIVSRLVPYKRLDIAIEAFNRLGWPLVVVGEGRYGVPLRQIAKPNIVFLGRVDEAALRELYETAIAMIFPGEEDFGIAPVEAMACGRPVIAYGKGGALETVIDGVTGKLFYEQSADALIEVLGTFRPGDYDPITIRAHAMKFDRSVFRERILGEVEAATGRPSSGGW